MMVARQFIAWDVPKKAVNTVQGNNHTVPYGTVPLMEPIPGNKLPGLRRAQSRRYDHSVPPGQVCFLTFYGFR
jgi:hypothetical protein